MLKCSSKPQWKEVWETSSADTQTSAKTSPDCRNTLTDWCKIGTGVIV